ncbi:SDR family oxidoreductase [soil metagenome]
MARILIAGCGYAGAATARLFHAHGWEVEGWTSSAQSAEALGALPFRVRAVDITSADAVAAAASASRFDVMIQSVGSRGGGADAYRRIYLEGARNLTSAFSEALPIFTSSTSVYAQTGGEWVTELSAAEPERETGRVLRETEELVLARGGIVLRLAGIYGPGRSALLRKFLAGTAVLDASGRRFINQVHRDDIPSALLLVAQRTAGGGSAPTTDRIFNVSDNNPRTDRDCYAWLAAQLGKPMPAVSDSPVERKRGNSSKRVSSARLQAAGWQPRYPTFESGMRESVLPGLEQLGA